MNAPLYYVAVANHDSNIDRSADLDSPPMVYESYLNESTREAAIARLRTMAAHNGGGRIAQLDFDLGGDPTEPHVVVAGHDGVHKDRGPLVWETYINEHATRDKAHANAALLEPRYGACRVARLDFNDQPNGAA